jgi:hypothetical protein
VSGRADRAIRASTAAAVLGVAGIAAYVSYQHAFQVVRAHGESGLTARLEPATIDGLVYSSSMVILYAARHRLPVPGLARWLLALGIVATLAANVAHGWSDGPVGAVVAAWPAASLVGSYELLLWLIRTSAACALAREPVADQPGGPTGQLTSGLWLVPAPDAGSPQPVRATGSLAEGSMPPVPARVPWAARVNEPGGHSPDHAYQPTSQQVADPSALEVPARPGQGEDEVNTAAVAAYRASIESGKPLSERKLAAMFGKTSRRWARSRMTEAAQLSLGMAASAAKRTSGQGSSFSAVT